MGLMRRVLDRLHPPGSAWRIIGSLALVMDGLADALESARTFIRAAWAESLPLTATDMLPEWHAALGQVYDPTQDPEFQRRMLDAIWTAFGGVQLNQLNSQMHKELADVDISEIYETDTTSVCGVGECGLAECGSTLEGSEVNPFIYDVAGTVNNDDEAARVASVIQHFAPLHLTPQSSLTILSDTGSAECGVGVVGIAECGNGPVNLIDRGDCESATPPMVAGETVPYLYNATFLPDATEFHGGAQSYKFTKTNAAGNTGSVSLTDNAVTTDMHGFLPGKTVTKRYWVKIPSGGILGSEVRFYIYDFYGLWQGSFVAAQDIYDAWQEITVTRKLRGTCTGVIIRMIAADTADLNESFNVDDIEIVYE